MGQTHLVHTWIFAYGHVYIDTALRTDEYELIRDVKGRVFRVYRALSYPDWRSLYYARPVVTLKRRTERKHAT